MDMPSAVGRLLDCFYFLDIMNNATVNICAVFE